MIMQFSSVKELMNYLSVVGLSVVRGDGGNLLLRGPGSEKTAKVVETVKKYKQEILEHLDPDGEQCGRCSHIVLITEDMGIVCEHRNQCPYRQENTANQRHNKVAAPRVSAQAPETSDDTYDTRDAEEVGY